MSTVFLTDIPTTSSLMSMVTSRDLVAVADGKQMDQKWVGRRVAGTRIGGGNIENGKNGGGWGGSGSTTCCGSSL